MDSEQNSVSQNSALFTPSSKIQLWATIGQGDRPPSDQTEGGLSALLFWLIILKLQAAFAAVPKNVSSLTAATSGPDSVADQLAPAAVTQCLPS